MHDLEARHVVRRMDAERAMKQSRWARELFADRLKRALDPQQAAPEDEKTRAGRGEFSKAGGRLARRTP